MVLQNDRLKTSPYYAHISVVLPVILDPFLNKKYINRD
jgi:hypothetical protein